MSFNSPSDSVTTIMLASSDLILPTVDGTDKRSQWAVTVRLACPFTNERAHVVI